jgi:hypothetical protein
MPAMNWRNIAVVLGLAVLLFGSFRALGWWGFSLVASGIVFWLLQLTTRLMQTMERAADQPVGTVANAVMFHAQLHRDLRLLKVIGLAASLSQRIDNEDKTTDIFEWRDAGGDSVQCHFLEGRLQQWSLARSNANPAAQDAT